MSSDPYFSTDLEGETAHVVSSCAKVLMDSNL